MRQACLIAISVLLGCAGEPPVTDDSPQTVAEPWAAVSLKPTGPPAYLGNPAFGMRLGHNGLGHLDGEPLPAFILLDDVLFRVPNPARVRLVADGHELAALNPSEYEARVDFRSGVRTVRWKERLRSGAEVSVKIESVAWPIDAAVSHRVTLKSDREVPLRVEDDFGEEEFRPATVSDREQPGFVSVFEGETHFRGGPPTILPGGVEVVFERTARMRSRGSGPAGAKLPLTLEFDRIAEHSRLYLAQRWQTDLIVDGPVEDQQAIRSFLFYLYISGNPKLPPMALSHEKYKGHRFWDAEAWLLPVYALVQPELARRATHWRLDTAMPGARIPWEAGGDGSDVTPPEFRAALHVNGWVYWWLDRAMALGLVNESRARELQRSIADDFRHYATCQNGEAHLLGVVSPDEGRLRDNDLTTNLLAKYAARGSGFMEFADAISIPRAEDGLPATFDNDHLRGYQQTAALLAIYPLEWPFPNGVPERMFDRYKSLTTEAGPAMSDSVHAVIAARLGRAEEAYRLWHESWKPFVRSEAMLFSERRGTDETYFATGAAGCLQAVIYGFLGLRVEKYAGGGAPASKPLLGGYHLTVRPNLPQTWRSVTFKNVRLPGGTFTIHANHDSVSITEGGD